MAGSPLHAQLPSPLTLTGDRELRFERPLVMGIVNVTPDSFSDGGQFLAVDRAVGHALKLIEEGADLIDIGGESTRPGADTVPAAEELRRVLPVVEQLRRQTTLPISVDTYKSEVARQVLAAGADIINDISALRTDPDMAGVVAQSGASVVLMHMQGTPQTMQQSPYYENCVEEVGHFFAQRIAFCTDHGIGADRIILDPGIGFGKRLQDNLDLLAKLQEFSKFRRPILVGASRKSFIGKVAESAGGPSERVSGSVAAAILAVLHGASVVRVHDVAATVEALNVVRAVVDRA